MISLSIIPKVLHKYTQQWYVVGVCIPKRDKLYATCYCIHTKGIIIIDMDHLIDVQPTSHQELIDCYNHNSKGQYTCSISEIRKLVSKL